MWMSPMVIPCCLLVSDNNVDSWQGVYYFNTGHLFDVLYLSRQDFTLWERSNAKWTTPFRTIWIGNLVTLLWWILSAMLLPVPCHMYSSMATRLPRLVILSSDSLMEVGRLTRPNLVSMLFSKHTEMRAIVYSRRTLIGSWILTRSKEWQLFLSLTLWDWVDTRSLFFAFSLSTMASQTSPTMYREPSFVEYTNFNRYIIKVIRTLVMSWYH